MKSITVNDVVVVFEYLYQHKYQRPEFKLRLEGLNLKIIQNFVDKISPFRGSEFLWDYSVFGFAWYEGQLTSRKLTVGWIYGDKMLQRYSKRTPTMIYYTQNFKHIYGLKNPLSHSYEYEMSEPYKVLQRRKYFNSIRGFLHCESFGGTLYDKKNSDCIACRFNSKCENMIKQENYEGKKCLQ